MASKIGRGKVPRGIGSKTGATGYKTMSVSRNAKGGDSGRADPGKGRQSKNMGSSGPKSAGPKYGRDTGSKVY